MVLIYGKKVILSLIYVLYACVGVYAIAPKVEEVKNQYYFYTDIIFYIYAIIGVTVAIAYSKSVSVKQWISSYLSALVVCLILIELRVNSILDDSFYYLITLGASSAAPSILAIWFSFVAEAKEDGGKTLYKASKRRLYKWISGEDEREERFQGYEHSHSSEEINNDYGIK